MYRGLGDKKKMIPRNEIVIRPINKSDTGDVGRLIASTFSKYNLTFVPDEERGRFLGPFQYADSEEKEHQEAIAAVISADMVFVAEANGEIVGVLRGRVDKLQSLFVSGAFHRSGIGRRLVSRFETECLLLGSSKIRVAATLYAVPFYLKMGYKKTTGVRTTRSFEGRGLPYQPMKKNLRTV